MEYTYIKKVGELAIDVFHSQEFDYKFIRKLLDRDANSIVEVYSRTSIDYPLSYIFTCSIE